MKKTATWIERAGDIVVGASFMVIGAWMVFLGVTFLPGIGIWLGVIAAGMGLSFFSGDPGEKKMARRRERALFIDKSSPMAGGGLPEPV